MLECGVRKLNRGAGKGANRSNDRAEGSPSAGSLAEATCSGVRALGRIGVTHWWGVGFLLDPTTRSGVLKGGVLTCLTERAGRSGVQVKRGEDFTGVRMGVRRGKGEDVGGAILREAEKDEDGAK